MQALVVGASGLVGSALLRALGPSAVGTYRTRPGPGLRPLDASDALALRRTFEESHAEIVFIPAGQPNVEWCERHPTEARDLNLAPIRAALGLADGIRIVGFSTDYVFDGENGPYAEGAPTRPLSVYGRIKLELEAMLLDRGHTVIRTTTVFGPELAPAKNFVLRLIGSLRRGEIVRAPSDQISTPTYSVDLARASVRIAGSDAGIWHVSGPDLVSRTELAARAARAFGMVPDLIRSVTTEELGQVAPRPLRGGLLCHRYQSLNGSAGRPLDDALLDLRRTLEA